MKKYPVDTEKRTLEMLNDCYEPVILLGHSYKLGNVLKKVDQILFHQVVLDFTDSNIRDELWHYDKKTGEIYTVDED